MTFHPQPKSLPKAPAKKEPVRVRRDRAMELWALQVKLRGGHVCEMRDTETEVECWGPVDAAHVIGRGRCPRLRLDPENGVALCRSHHDAYDKTRWFRPHFNAWFDSKYPGRRASLQAKSAREARLE